MKVPVTKVELKSLDYMPDFNKVHGTSFLWDDYYEALGIERGMDDEDVEYEAYVRWCEIRNSPLVRALK